MRLTVYKYSPNAAPAYFGADRKLSVYLAKNIQGRIVSGPFMTDCDDTASRMINGSAEADTQLVFCRILEIKLDGKHLLEIETPLAFADDSDPDPDLAASDCPFCSQGFIAEKDANEIDCCCHFFDLVSGFAVWRGTHADLTAEEVPE